MPFSQGFWEDRMRSPCMQSSWPAQELTLSINSHHTNNEVCFEDEQTPQGTFLEQGRAYIPVHPLCRLGCVGKGADPPPLYGQDGPRAAAETCESVTGIKQLMGVPPWLR